jgi:hypothetical protein
LSDDSYLTIPVDSSLGHTAWQSGLVATPFAIGLVFALPTAAERH